MTPDALQKLTQVFALDGSVEEACYYADISVSTYYNWIKKKPELLEGFDRIRNKPILAARMEVVKGIDNNPEFALRFLERKRSNEFGPKTKHEHSGSIGQGETADSKETEAVREEYEGKLRDTIVKSHEKKEEKKI